MENIAYINDLIIEIEILKNLRDNSKNNIEKIEEIIVDKENTLNKCKENLKKLSNNQIEYRLYLKMLNGKTVSQAVDEIANENYINDIKPNSTAGIWLHYKKLKKLIN